MNGRTGTQTFFGRTLFAILAGMLLSVLPGGPARAEDAVHAELTVDEGLPEGHVIYDPLIRYPGAYSLSGNKNYAERFGWSNGRIVLDYSGDGGIHFGGVRNTADELSYWEVRHIPPLREPYRLTLSASGDSGLPDHFVTVSVRNLPTPGELGIVISVLSDSSQVRYSLADLDFLEPHIDAQFLASSGANYAGIPFAWEWQRSTNGGRGWETVQSDPDYELSPEDDAGNQLRLLVTYDNPGDLGSETVTSNIVVPAPSRIRLSLGTLTVSEDDGSTEIAVTASFPPGESRASGTTVLVSPAPSDSDGNPGLAAGSPATVVIPPNSGSGSGTLTITLQDNPTVGGDTPLEIVGKESRGDFISVQSASVMVLDDDRRITVTVDDDSPPGTAIYVLDPPVSNPGDYVLSGYSGDRIRWDDVSGIIEVADNSRPTNNGLSHFHYLYENPRGPYALTLSAPVRPDLPDYFVTVSVRNQPTQGSLYVNIRRDASSPVYVVLTDRDFLEFNTQHIIYSDTTNYRRVPVTWEWRTSEDGGDTWATAAMKATDRGFPYTVRAEDTGKQFQLLATYENPGDFGSETVTSGIVVPKPREIRLSLGTLTVSENDGSTGIEVTASFPDGESRARDTTVLVSPAPAGSDGNPGLATGDPATVTIPADSGSGSGTLTITLQDNQAIAGDASLEITGRDSRGTFMTVSTVTVTVLDDEATVHFTATVDEGSPAGQVVYPVPPAPPISSPGSHSVSGNRDHGDRFEWVGGRIRLKDGNLSHWRQLYGGTPGPYTLTLSAPDGSGLPDHFVTVSVGNAPTPGTVSILLDSTDRPILAELTDFDFLDTSRGFIVAQVNSATPTFENTSVAWDWQMSADGGANWESISGSFENRVRPEDAGNQLRLLATYDNPGGLGRETVTSNILVPAPNRIMLGADPTTVGEGDGIREIAVTASFPAGQRRSSDTTVNVALPSSGSGGGSGWAAADPVALVIPANTGSGVGSLTISLQDNPTLGGDVTLEIAGSESRGDFISVQPVPITVRDDERNITFSVPESTPVGEAVGDISVDGGTAYTLVGGGTSPFALDSSGVLRTGTALDLEDGGPNSFTLTAGVTVGSESKRITVTVSVTDANDPGTLTIITNRYNDVGESFSGYLQDEDLADPVGEAILQWERSVDGGEEWNDIEGAVGILYVSTRDDAGNQLRARAVYDDGHGPTVVTSEPVTIEPTTVTLAVSETSVVSGQGIDEGVSGGRAPIVVTASLPDGKTRNRPTTVTISVVPGTAESPSDFSSRPIRVTIPADETSQVKSFALGIVDDNRLESDETVIVRGSESRGVLDVSSVTLTIRDNDGYREFTVDENGRPGSIIGTVSVDGGSGYALEGLTPAEARLFSIDPDGVLRNEQTLNHEFRASHDFTVSLTVGSEPKDIRVSVNVRNLDEIGAVYVSHPGGHVVGGRANVVLLLDQDVRPGISDFGFPVGDAGWQWERQVEHNGPWSPIEGATGTSYVFARADAGHRVRVKASYADHQGPGKSATSDPAWVAPHRIDLRVTPTKVGEGAGTVILTVFGSYPDGETTAADSSVLLAVEDGSATGGQDYTLFQGRQPDPFAIPPGRNEWFGLVTLVLSDDRIIEGDESIRIGAPKIRGLLDVGAATIEIVDNELVRTVTVREDAPSGAEVANLSIDGGSGYALRGASTLFEVDSGSGVLRTRNTLNHEATPAVTLTVDAMVESAPRVITVVVDVENVNDPGSIFLTRNGSDYGIGVSVTGHVFDQDGEADSPVRDVRWQWQFSDTSGEDGWRDVSNATRNNLEIRRRQAGYRLRAKATYTDSFGPGQVAFSDSFTVLPREILLSASPSGVHEGTQEEVVVTAAFPDRGPQRVPHTTVTVSWASGDVEADDLEAFDPLEIVIPGGAKSGTGTLTLSAAGDRQFDEADEMLVLGGQERRGILRVTPVTLDIYNSTRCENEAVIPGWREKAGLVEDCEVLLAFKESLRERGAIDEGWSEYDPLAEWVGVGIGAVGGLVGGETRVTELRLASMGLSGNLPALLGDLTGLTWLDLSDNSLGGRIPGELGNLRRLRTLALSRNSLEGGIPPELGGLPELRRLGIGSAGLTGTIPAELGNLERLEVLSLPGNRLSGEIPAELGRLANLDSLDLQANRLTGWIPAEIGSLRGLRVLALDRNLLEGPIPAELGNLLQLERLSLLDNRLTGGIPAELTRLARLEWLVLSNNRLTGGIPEGIGSLTRLWVLGLANNELEGAIPDELAELTLLERLHLEGNSLDGVIPRGLGSLVRLRLLDIRDNLLSGWIPIELGNFQSLEPGQLGLKGNDLVACLPPVLAAFGSSINPQRGGRNLPVCTNGLVLSPTALSVVEGSRATYNVGLASPPYHGDVTVVVTAPEDVQVGGGESATITFSLGNWYGGRDVEVLAAEEDDGVSETVDIRHETDNPGYQGYHAKGATLPLTVTDNDAPDSVELSVNPTVALEGAGVVSLAVEAGFPGDRPEGPPTSVTVSVDAGTAQEGVDYSPGDNLTVGIGPYLDAAGEIVLTITQDAVVEGDETLVIGGTAGTLSVDPVTVTIVDDELSVTVDKDSVPEGGGPATVGVTVFAPGGISGEGARVVGMRVAGRGGEDAVDFAAVEDFDLTIPAGAASVTGSFVLIPENDAFDEADETVVVTGELEGRMSSAQILLTDDDDPPGGVELNLDRDKAAERDGPVKVKVKASVSGTTRFATERTVTVSVSGSGVADAVDFAPVDGFEITIPAGDNSGRASFILEPEDDNVDEADETVLVSGASGEASVTSATLALTDDDDPPVGVVLSLDPDSVSEGAGLTVVSVTASVAGDTRFAGARTVDVSVAPSGEENAVDFEPVEGFELVLPAEASTVAGAFVLDLDDDLVDEMDETATVAGTAAGVTVAPALLTIIDNDGFPTEIALSVEPDTLIEGPGGEIVSRVVSVTAAIVGDIRFVADQVVRVTVSDSAAGDAVGYVSSPKNIEITIPAGEASARGTFGVIPEGNWFDDEDATVTVSGSSAGVSVSSATIALLDDDVAPTEVELSAFRTTYSEAGSFSFQGGVPVRRAHTVRFEANIVGEYRIEEPQEVTLSVSGSGIEGAVDVGPIEDITITVTIFGGARGARGSVIVDPVDDQVDEEDETLTISGSSQGLRVTPLAVTITDDDDAPRNISLSTSLPFRNEEVSEGAGPTEITVTASIGGATRFGEDHEVTVSAAGSGSETAADFEDIDGFVITIPAGEAAGTETFTLVPENDNIDEENERVTLSGTSSVEGVTVTPASLTLVDDDDAPSGIVLSLDRESLREGAGSTAIAVTASVAGGTRFAQDLAVRVSVSGSGVGAAVDFGDVGAFNLIIPAGGETAVGSFSLEPVDDSVDEEDETVTVSGESSGVDVTPASLSLTDDDDPPAGIALSVRPASVSEDAGPASVMVTASVSGSTRYAGARVVAVSVAGSGVAAAADFVPVEGFNLTIPAEAASVTGSFTLEPVDDDVDEADETVTVSGESSGADVTPASLSLTDDDAAPSGIVLSVDPDSIAEGSGPTAIAVTASVSGGTRFAAERVVAVAVSGSGVAAAVDFAEVSGFNIAIPAGAVTATRSFTLLPDNDQVDEVDETVTVSGTSTGVNVSPASVALTDDDAVPSGIVLSVDPASVSENVGSMSVAVTASVSGGTRYATERVVAVAVSGSGVAAAVDFADVPGFNITIPAGAVTATGSFTLLPGNDQVDEVDEAVTVSGTSTGVNVSPASVALTDDDAAPSGVVLSVDPASVSENAGSRSVAVTASVSGGARYATERVVAVAVSGSGVETAVDFADVPGFNITIPADAVTATGSFTLLPGNDQVDEVDEVVTVSGTSTGVNVSPASVALTDDDAAPSGIVLSVDPASVSENVGSRSVAVTASVSGGTRFAAERVVAVAVSGSGVETAVDFAEVSGFNIAIPAGAATATGSFTLAPDNDQVDETDETVTVSGTSSGVGVEPADISLTDDDASPSGIALTVDPASVSENVGSRSVAVTASVSGGTRYAMERVVAVAVTGSGVETAVDFAEVSGFNITIPAGVATATGSFTLAPDNDQVDETDETVTVSGTSSGVGVEPADISLTDDDASPSGIALTVDPASVSEGGGTATIAVTASVSGGTRFADGRVVAVTVADSGAAAAVGFTPVAPFNISIPAGDVTATGSFTLTPDDDQVDEADETVTVSGTSAGVSVTPASLVLEDDDAAPSGIVLSLGQARVPEGGGAQVVLVTASVSGGTRFAGGRVVAVTVAGSGAATAVDFTPVAPFNISIPAGDVTATGSFTLAPDDDQVDETDETVTVSGTSAGVSVTPANLALADDDAAPSGIVLSLGQARVPEGGGAQVVLVTASVSGGTRFAGGRVVAVTVAGSGAATAVDFTPVAPFNISIPAEDDTATGPFTLVPDDDRVDEADETVTVSGTSSGVSVDPASLSLADDDDAPTRIVLSVDPASVSEGVGSAAVAVTASVAGSTRFATERVVSVSVSGSGAATAVDFASVAGFELAVPAEAASVTGSFNLVPVDDSEDESDETVTVSGTSDGVSVDPASLALTDDDGSPTGIVLSVDPSSVPEGGGTAAVAVTASVSGGTHFSEKRVVSVSVTGGNAANAVDFVPVEGFELAIPAGTASVTGSFNLAPVDDSEDEADETVTVSGTSAGVNVTPASLALADDDDSPAGIVLSVDPASVSEGSGPAAIVVTASVSGGTRYADLRTVSVSVSGSGAAAAVGFAPVDAFELAIPAGAASVTGSFTLGPEDDQVDEADETVIVSGTSPGVDVTPASMVLADDDAAPSGIVVELDSTRVSEGGGAKVVRVTVSVSGGTRYSTGRQVAVSVAGNGAGAAVDFAPVAPFDLAIPAGSVTATGSFTLAPEDDQVDETDETVTVSGISPGVIVTPANLSLTDDDDSPAGIALSVDPVSVSEGGGSTAVAVTASVAGGTRFATGRVVSVSVAGSGAATAVGFAPVAGFELALPAEAASVTGSFNLAPVDDREDESDETVTVSGTSSGVSVTPANLSITDDDDSPSGIVLAASHASVSEGGGPVAVVVTASVSGGTRYADERAVSVSVAGGGVDTAVDFIPVAPFNITIPAGDVTATGSFTLEPEDDRVDEADETVTVSGTSAGVSVSPASLSLADDDAAPTRIVLSVDPASASEGGGSAAVAVTASVDGGTRFATERVVSVSVSGSGAAGAVDFAPVAGFELAIPAEAASVTGSFNLVPVDDLEDESDETVTVSGTSAGVIVDPAGLSLTDDDATPAGIVLSVDPASVPEDSGPTVVAVTASVSGSTRYATDRTVSVSVSGSGAAAAVDFAPVEAFDLAIPAGAASVTGSFALEPEDDQVDETDETVTVSGTSAGAGVTPANLVLADDDTAPSGIVLELDQARVLEGGGAKVVVVTASVTGGTRYSAERVVAVSVGGTGVTTAVDFAKVGSFNITVPAGASSALESFTMVPEDDNIDETDETVAVSGSSPGVSVTRADLPLIDDDGAPERIVLSTDPASVSEGGGPVGVAVTASIAGGTRYATDRPVRVSVTGGGAATAVGFAQVASFDLVIPTGEDSVARSFNLEPVDNLVDEDDETVTVSGASPDAEVVPATLALTDDDAAPAGIVLSVDPASVSEGGGPALVAVTASVAGGTRYAAERVVSVSVAGSGAEPAVDFAPVGGFVLAIPAGSVSVEGAFSLEPADDQVDETDETVTVSGTSPGVTVDPASVTLMDDDGSPTGIVLSVDPASVSEGGGPAVVAVTASVAGGTRYAAERVVSVSVAGSGAEPAVDFAPVGGFALAIPAGSVSVEGAFSLEPADDQVDETDETVTVSGTSPGVTVDPASVTLMDDDGSPTGIVLSVDPASVSEGGGPAIVAVTASVSGSTRYSTARTVSVAVSGSGVATAVDFAPVTGFELAIPAGAASVEGSFNLEPEDDRVDEVDETVTVSGTASGISVDPASLSIVDDDASPGGIVLAAGSASVSEGDGPLVVKVTATVAGNVRFATARTVSVTVSGSGNPAAVDFVPVDDFVLVVPEGDSRAVGSFSLEPVDDRVDETDERLVVTGTSPGLAVDLANLVITDDDDPPTGIVLSVDPTLVSEGGGATAIAVTASVTGGTRYSTERTVSVSVAGSGNAAAADFAAVGGFEFAIPAGSVTATGSFSLEPIDDQVDEADETVIVTGTSAEANVGPTSLVLVDDDAAPAGIVLSVDPASVPEDGGPAVVAVTASVSGGTRYSAVRTVSVSVSSSDIAVAVDFAPVGGFELAIPAGEVTTTGSFTLAPEDDRVDEADETVTVSGTSPGVSVTPAGLALTDDDGSPTGIVLSVGPSSVSEGGGPATVAVTASVTGGTRFAAERTVSVSVSGSGVEAAADFAPVGGFELAIPAGEVTATGSFTLAPEDDRVDEADETVTVSGTSTGMGVRPASLVLADDDASPTGVSLSVFPGSFPESAGRTAVSVTASVSGGTYFAEERTVTISVSGSADETAVDFVVDFDVPDFTVAAASEREAGPASRATAPDSRGLSGRSSSADLEIVIPAEAGRASGSFNLTPEDDRVDEDDETVTVSGAAGAIPVRSASLSIIDDDASPGGIVLTAGTASVPEGGGPAVIAVTASISGGGLFPTARAVSVSVSGGGDETAVDFAPVEGFVITVPAGESSAAGSFTLEPVDDRVDESDETVTLSGRSSGVDVTPASLALTDDDSAPAGIVLSADPDSVPEGGGAAVIAVTASVAGGTRYAAGRTVSVTVAGSGVAAAVDFAPVDGFDLAIPAGGLTATGSFTLEPVDDRVDGPDETVTVSGTSSGVTVDPASLSLTDDDGPPTRIVLAVDPASASEGGGPAEVVVTASVTGGTRFATERTVSVSVSGSGAEAAVDFAPVEGFNLAIPAGEVTATVSFTLVPEDDRADEADETVTVSGTSSGVVVDPASLSLVDDDDAPTRVVLSVDPASVSEGGGPATVAVTASVAGSTRFAAERVVSVSVTGSGAENAVDFASVAGFELAIPAEAASVTGSFNLVPVDDSEDEADETVTVSGESSGVVVDPASLSLTDDDGSPTGIVRPKLDFDVDESGEINHHDALLTFYTWRFGPFLRANMRLTDLVYGRIQWRSGSTIPTIRVLENAEAAKSASGVSLLDVDESGEVDHHDALLIFYSWRFGPFLRANMRLTNLVYGRIQQQTRSTIPSIRVLDNAANMPR